LAELCTSLDYSPECAIRFKILTCSATSCAQKRKILGLDEFATFSAFFARVEERIPEMQVEETSCLGSCKKAPCVAIEHEEYEGTVALEGMDAFEFSDRVFHKVIDESDAERVWACIENAVQVMSEVKERNSDD
jgi:(2Fe-2S) ferredoxin